MTEKRVTSKDVSISLTRKLLERVEALEEHISVKGFGITEDSVILVQCQKDLSEEQMESVRHSMRGFVEKVPFRIHILFTTPLIDVELLTPKKAEVLEKLIHGRKAEKGDSTGERDACVPSIVSSTTDGEEY